MLSAREGSLETELGGEGGVSPLRIFFRAYFDLPQS